jgi:Ca-activated chloride channel family protein
VGRKAALAVSLAGLLGLACHAARAQEAVFRADVRLVRLLVTAKNEGGRPAGGLEQSNFTVFDSGVRQEIAVFERYTSQPLSIALLIDTSGSTAKDLKYEVTAAARFVRALVAGGNPADALSVYSFNHDVTLQTGFTRHPGRVERVLQQLRAEAGTSLYDAVTLAAEPLAAREGRKVVIVITDGGDTTSVRTYDDALRALHRADAVLYPIVVVPVANDAGRNTGGENALTSMARSTGGSVFFLAGFTALESAFTDILRDLRTQYLIGYYPRNLPPARSPFRRVSVQVDRPGLRAETRDGYYER